MHLHSPRSSVYIATDFDRVRFMTRHIFFPPYSLVLFTVSHRIALSLYFSEMKYAKSPLNLSIVHIKVAKSGVIVVV